MLVQIKIDKKILKSYLNRIEVEINKFCECEEMKNVQHVLLQCSKWAKLRTKYYEQDWRNLKKFLNNSTFVKKSISLLINTRLFKQFRNVKNITIFDDKKNYFFKNTQDNDELSKVIVINLALDVLHRRARDMILLEINSHAHIS